jgi:hypothetical protein
MESLGARISQGVADDTHWLFVSVIACACVGKRVRSVPLDMSRKHSQFPYPESSDPSLAEVLLRQEPEEEEEEEEEEEGPSDDNDDDEEDDEEDDGYSACLCFRGGLVRTGAVHMM